MCILFADVETELRGMKQWLCEAEVRLGPGITECRDLTRLVVSGQQREVKMSEHKVRNYMTFDWFDFNSRRLRSFRDMVNVLVKVKLSPFTVIIVCYCEETRPFVHGQSLLAKFFHPLPVLAKFRRKKMLGP